MRFKFLVGLILASGVSACKSSSLSDVRADDGPDIAAQEETPAKPAHLTIELLKNMKPKALFELIKERGTSVECIPEGVASGLPGEISDENIQKTTAVKTIFAGLLNFIPPKDAQAIAGLIWKGKVFTQNSAQTGGCSKGTGTNRIAGRHRITMTNQVLSRETYLGEQKQMNPDELNFITALNENTHREGVNLVELNYSNPKDDIVGAGRGANIRDIMVPIRQDDGTVIYIGRAYTGIWTVDDDQETHYNSEGLLAWFFLDFDENAPLTVQKLAEMDDVLLNKLIQTRGVYRKCIPVYDAQGLPGDINVDAVNRSNIVQAGFKLIFTMLGGDNTEMLAGAFWKGKIFNRTKESCSAGVGSNIILGQKLITLTNRTISKADFINDPKRNATEPGEGEFVRALENNQAPNGSEPVNLVELNYSNPGRDFLKLGGTFGIRDVMVPISQNDGKDGQPSSVIYIGRAYAGKWTPDGKAFTSQGLLAWFFLDYVKRDAFGVAIPENAANPNL
jgi:hypothetical protein